MKILEGKVAIVTGASRGIGKMIASGLCANGVKVYISSRKGSALLKTQDELINKYNAECIAVPCDLSTQEGIDTLYEKVSADEKGIDFLINNAGAVSGNSLDTFSESDWDNVMDLNVKSVFFLTQKFKSLLKINATFNDPSRVVNIGSVSGIINPGTETYSYSSSKAAVHHLTRSLAGVLVKENILVNAIAPGPYPSDLLGPAINYNYGMVEEDYRKMAEQTVSRKLAVLAGQWRYYSMDADNNYSTKLPDTKNRIFYSAEIEDQKKTPDGINYMKKEGNKQVRKTSTPKS